VLLAARRQAHGAAASLSGRFAAGGLGRRKVPRKIGERFAESSRQTRARYPYQNTTLGGVLSSRIYPYTINVRTRLKNLNSRSEAQRTGKEGRDSRAAEKSKTAPLKITRDAAPRRTSALRFWCRGTRRILCATRLRKVKNPSLEPQGWGTRLRVFPQKISGLSLLSYFNALTLTVCGAAHSW
jgi:hypothetical protein